LWGSSEINKVTKGKPVKIRAKMYVVNITRNGGTEQIRLGAVTSGSEENKSFSKATPSASVDIAIDNPGAQNQFQQGKEYYVDFTPA
jgi:hypothetical protein